MDFAGARDDDERNVSVAENAELVSLLEESVASLRIRDLPVRRVLDPLDLDFPSRHINISTKHLFFLCHKEKREREREREKGMSLWKPSHCRKEKEGLGDRRKAFGRVAREGNVGGPLLLTAMIRRFPSLLLIEGL